MSSLIWVAHKGSDGDKARGSYSSFIVDCSLCIICPVSFIVRSTGQLGVTGDPMTTRASGQVIIVPSPQSLRDVFCLPPDSVGVDVIG